jgi:hypothetical protein
MKIVRPLESTADTHPKLHPAFLRLLAMISQCPHETKSRHAVKRDG